MRLVWYCRGCLQRHALDAPAGPSAMSCGRCGKEAAWTPPAAPLSTCGLCACPALYREKDFPAALGCLLLLAAVAAFLATENLWVLIGAAAVDATLYLFLPSRAVCYRCLAEYRGADLDSKVSKYDLAVAGRYADRR